MAQKYLKRFTKDPDAILDYRINWSLWLANSGGDTIVSAVSLPDSGITVVSTTNTTTTGTMRVSGGTVDTDYLVTMRVTLASGQKDDRSLLFAVRQR
jgi:hypothetical protein